MKCAAANDEEDLGGLLDDRDSKRVRKNSSEGSIEANEQPPKKKKAFAWMDSDDEDDGDLAKEEVEERPPVVEKPSEDDDEEATLDRLEQVETFGRMVLLSESLGKKLKVGNLGSLECLAACRALARSKFFDSDLLEGLCLRLTRMIELGQVTMEQAHDAVVCMKELNFYNADLFSAIAKAFKQQVAIMHPGMRAVWHEAMQVLGHKKDNDFLQLLQVPPLLPGNPSYRIIRCVFFVKGHCELGTVCTYAHNMQAPISLVDASKEDAWRTRSVTLTQGQMYSVGSEAYSSKPLL